MSHHGSDLISVIIPTYNRASCLSRAIDSVLAQSYRTLELIVVDDGSTDDTPAVLARYGNRIRSIRQANGGASKARNAGIAASRGSIVSFLDSDDSWLPTKLEKQVALMARVGETSPCCLSNITLAYSNGEQGTSFELSLIKPALTEGLWTNVLPVLATRFILFNQAVAVRRSALERLGGFDENFSYMEDYDLALRLALLGPWCYVAEPLVVWNEGSAGSLTKRAERERVELQKTIFGIHQKICGAAEAFGCDSQQRRQLGFELFRNRVKLVATSLSHGPSRVGRLSGTALHRLESLLDSLYTHSPWYPTMEVASVR
jgi:glycosyltransferase involved in cell wall biosynthesis